MKRAKVNGRPAPVAGHQHEILFERAGARSVNDGKGQEESSTRMLDNLKLALFFSQAQGRMARGEH